MGCIVPSGCIHTCNSPNYCYYNAIHGYANSSHNSSRLKNRRCELTLRGYTFAEVILLKYNSGIVARLIYLRETRETYRLQDFVKITFQEIRIFNSLALVSIIDA